MDRSEQARCLAYLRARWVGQWLASITSHQELQTVVPAQGCQTLEPLWDRVTERRVLPGNLAERAHPEKATRVKYRRRTNLYFRRQLQRSNTVTCMRRTAKPSCAVSNSAQRDQTAWE